MSLAAAALALGWLAPAGAQDTAAPPSSSEEVIGPPQLRDFTLNGTVTRRAEEPPARNQPATTNSSPASPSAATRSPPTTQGQTDSRAATAGALRQAPAANAPRTASASTAPGLPFDLPPPTPGSDPPVALTPGSISPQPAASPGMDVFTPSTGETEDGWLSRLPWLLALLAAVGAAIWYFRRQRSGYTLAGAGASASAFDLGGAPVPAQQRAPTPAPQPRMPVPDAAPPPPAAPKGIVSTRLRPWLDIEFSPQVAVLDGERATIHFDILVFNSGSAPAREVLVEAALFNAGEDQDQAIGAFFSHPVGNGDRVPVIQPLQRMSFTSAVSLPREQLRIFEVGGRRLFVPLIAFNALYGWSSGQGQTSASYIIGRDTDGEKMAPFRVDAGPKTFGGLGAREHSLRVRK